MDRCWLLTSTTYGTWLPGDERGSVTRVWGFDGPREMQNEPGTDYVAPSSGLAQAARENLKGPPIFFTLEHAEKLLVQFKETAQYRGWDLLAVAIMRNHIHLVVGVPGDPDPEIVLGNFKSYGSRVLNRIFGTPQSETWWTKKGSTRKLPHETAIRNAIEYVRNQYNPLVLWIADEETIWRAVMNMPPRSANDANLASGGA